MAALVGFINPSKRVYGGSLFWQKSRKTVRTQRAQGPKPRAKKATPKASSKPDKADQLGLGLVHHAVGWTARRELHHSAGNTRCRNHACGRDLLAVDAAALVYSERKGSRRRHKHVTPESSTFAPERIWPMRQAGGRSLRRKPYGEKFAN